MGPRNKCGDDKWGEVEPIAPGNFGASAFNFTPHAALNAQGRDAL